MQWRGESPTACFPANCAWKHGTREVQQRGCGRPLGGRGEDAGDFGAEAGEVDGFDEVGKEAGGAGGLEVFFLAEAAEGDAGEGVAAGAEGADEVQAGAVGEAKVAEDQVEGVGGGEGQGGGDVGGGLDAVAVGGQEAVHDAGGVLMVFDEENADWAMAGGPIERGGGWGRVVGEGRGGGAKGEADGEGGALAFAGAVGVDGSAVEFDEGLGDGESEAEAAELAGDGALGLFEGVEDAAEVVGVDAFAVVGDLDRDEGRGSGAKRGRGWFRLGCGH